MGRDNPGMHSDPTPRPEGFIRVTAVLAAKQHAQDDTGRAGRADRRADD